jgi:transcription elongation factor GreB
MSKAFLRESDFGEPPEVPRVAVTLPPGAKNYLTSEGAQRLRDELARLIQVERPRLGSPEDADDRRALKVIDQRIRHLQKSLRSAEIVVPESGTAEIVRFGHTVTVRASDGVVTKYRIVGVDEADGATGRISWQSPLAKALLNARRGERVRVTTPGGFHEVEILAIRGED